MFNNPISFADPEGDLPWLALAIAATKGAGIGVVANGINNTINGQGFFQGAGSSGIGSFTQGWSPEGQLLAGIAGGGLASLAGGGNFFEGAKQGAIIIGFSLTIKQVKKLVKYFRSIGKWTTSYYYDYGDFTITPDELFDILKLRAPFWMDQSLYFDFDGGDVSLWAKLQECYKKNKYWICIQRPVI